VRETPLFLAWGGKVREVPLFLEWGQTKGIGKVHYFWDRVALLFTGMGE
jgi:hypothetical protein